VYSLEKRVAFESREQDMMDFESASLNGIVSLPQRSEAFLAITNVASGNVSVELMIGSKKKTLTLAPRETQLVKLNQGEDADRNDRGDQSDNTGASATAMLVRLQHNGRPGDIITTAYVWNLKNGYSSAFTMIDPKTNRSNTVAGVHFRSGTPDPAEGFQDGTIFHSPLLLANVSDKPVKTHVSVTYTTHEKLQMTPIDPKKDATEEKVNNVPVRDITIGPGEIQPIELPAAASGTVQDSGVDVMYEGDPGAIIGQLTSVDRSGDYAFEVPIKDPAGMNEMMGGAYPWSIENGANAVLHLKNTTADSVIALATFVLPDGATYRLDQISLQPYQSIAVDIQKLKASKKKDVLKQVFPAGAVKGQVQWHQETPYSIIGRLETTNAKEGIARSFSCSLNCCYNYSASALVSPSSQTGVAGFTGSVSGTYSGTDCNSVPFGPIAIAPGSWTVDNSAVATLSGSGATDTVNYVGAGTTNVWGNNFRIQNYALNSSGTRCMSLFNYQTTGAQVNVCVPASVRVLQDNTTWPNGTNLYNYCNNQVKASGSWWGIQRCFLFQLVDSCGRDITGGNYKFTENRTPYSMNPTGQAVNNENSSNIYNGQFTDFLSYAWTYTPTPSNWTLNVNQSITAIDQNTGKAYPIATFCQKYQSTPLGIATHAGSCP
jgi:hypothetical protein